MALVECPECGQQVSTEAVSCPHCGKPLSSRIGATPGAPSVFVAPASAPGPEQVLWEGRPSIALLYGKILRLFLRLVIVVVIGYLAVSMVLPAVASISPETRSFIDQNTPAIELGIVVVSALALLPSFFALFGAAARIRNTSYKV